MTGNPFLRLLALCLSGLAGQAANGPAAAAPVPPVVINEIHFAPPDREPLEFVELHNPGGSAVDLSGWSIARFTFPGATRIEAGGYLVVAAHPAEFTRVFQVPALGPLPGRLSNQGESIVLRDASRSVVEQVHYRAGFPWPTAAAGGGSSIERLHASMPAERAGSWRSSGFAVGRDGGGGKAGRPTPGARNSVDTTNVPPSILAVEQNPRAPRPGEAVLVTAAIGDPGRVERVDFRMQVVEPGSYWRLDQPEFRDQWRELSMHDDGRDGDARAGDGIFSVQVPAEVQKHRRLVRYQVAARTREGMRVQVPYPDDGCPNFAWFVYGGVPDWTGASRPGRSPTNTFPSALLQTLPVYHLLARRSDVERCQWSQDSAGVRFEGALVHDGAVYDHIQFHIRGKGSTYVSGKNKWGFKFHRTHEFAARDNRGHPYPVPWEVLDLNACASPWAPVNHGMAGMDEAVSMRAFQLAGVPASKTHWVHFRVIDEPAEAPTTNQYDGDLWGLYLAVQQPGGDWLKELGLPDGNLFYPERGLTHHAPGMPRDASDWNDLLGHSNGSTPEAWWRSHLNLDAFYSFHAMNQVVGNIDLRDDGNHYMYRSPTRGWTAVPWDLDMMFIPRVHWPGVIPAVACLEQPVLKREYESRGREILDLFCADPTPTGGQVGQLIEELAQVLRPAGATNAWPELDMAMWNWHPRSNARGEFYRNPYVDGGRRGGPWTRTLASRNFEGFCRYILEFCTDSRPGGGYAPNDGDQRGYGYGFLFQETLDPQAPPSPVIQYTGADSYALDRLRFATEGSDAVRTTAGVTAIQWRVGWISCPGRPGYKAGSEWHYELEPHWVGRELADLRADLVLPKSVCTAGNTYRVRARYRGAEGRWGHWSKPVEFVAGPPAAP